MTTDPFNLRLLSSYQYLEQVSTRYSDQDAMGHVNNIAYAAYIEAGHLGYFLKLIASSGTVGLNYVLANLMIVYWSETYFPGVIVVGAKMIRLGNRSLTTGYGIFKYGTCHSTATCVNVHIDTTTQKSAPIAALVHQRLLAELAK